MDRKHFLGVSLATSVGFSLLPAKAFTGNQLPRKDPLDRELVYEFVKVAHSDLSRVEEMLKETPQLLNSSHDWGNGDFESGIGGASHMGRTAIVKFLLSKGAQMNIFTAAMLGELDMVRQQLTSYPNLITSKGPHGLDLVHHAKVGREQSTEVLNYLLKLKG